MSGDNISSEISITGGIYRELCYWPNRNHLFGSAWRSARVMRALAPDVRMRLVTAGDDVTTSLLKAYSTAENLNYTVYPEKELICFSYKHPLAVPTVSGRPLEKIHLRAEGTCVIGFGMIEATTEIRGSYVVYDPQSPREPRWFRDQGGEAEHLALVMNKSEASILSGETDLQKIKQVIFEYEGCECLIIKCGAQGAMVFCGKEDEGTHIPAYKTEHVWPIGSGDVFTTVFSYYWFKDVSPVEASIKASQAAASYCESDGDFENLPLLLKTNEFCEYIPRKKGKIYLAGPFFTLSEKLFVAECRDMLMAMGMNVFSPYHDVGEGKAEDVVPKDIAAIDDCDCLFAILDGMDSGTLFEIGYAVKSGIKVVAYGENTTEGELKMLVGTGCDVNTDFTTALYKTCWYAAE